MATQQIYRIHAIVPTALCAGLNADIKANIDPTGGDWLIPSLSATGDPPYTHAHCSAALTAPQLKKMAGKLLSLASIPLVADFDTKTKAQKLAWLLSQRTAVDAAIGISVNPMGNDGVWSNPQVSLDQKGLKTPTLPPTTVL